jgi:hypothetical protein
VKKRLTIYPCAPRRPLLGCFFARLAVAKLYPIACSSALDDSDYCARAVPHEFRPSRTKSGRLRGKRFKKRSCSILSTLDSYVRLGRCVLIKGFAAKSVARSFIPVFFPVDSREWGLVKPNEDVLRVRKPGRHGCPKSKLKNPKIAHAMLVGAPATERFGNRRLIVQDFGACNQVLEHEGNAGGAEQYYKQSIKVNSSNADPICCMASLLLSSSTTQDGHDGDGNEKTREAGVLLDKALEIDPNHVAALCASASLYEVPYSFTPRNALPRINFLHAERFGDTGNLSDHS